MADALSPHEDGMNHRTALIVEGGAMRGIFACGVLEVFQEQNFGPFDLAIGCSAGACILASHLAEQRQRNFTVYTKYMTRPEFISGRRFVRGGHWVDFDWLWQAAERDVPIDRAKLAASSTRFLISCTSYATGEPVYLEPNAANLMEALKSSCALPVLYREPVHFEAQRLMDGGIAAPIPVQEAYRRGARRIVVVRSRPAEFVKRPSALNKLAALAFRSSPPFGRALQNAYASYQAAIDFITSPPPDCTIVHVAPRTALATQRTTQDLCTLERDYSLGREAGQLAIEEWNAPCTRPCHLRTASSPQMRTHSGGMRTDGRSSDEARRDSLVHIPRPQQASPLDDGMPTTCALNM